MTLITVCNPTWKTVSLNKKTHEAVGDSSNTYLDMRGAPALAGSKWEEHQAPTGVRGLTKRRQHEQAPLQH